jgi:hypothetical protein
VCDRTCRPCSKSTSHLFLHATNPVLAHHPAHTIPDLHHTRRVPTTTGIRLSSPPPEKSNKPGDLAQSDDSCFTTFTHPIEARRVVGGRRTLSSSHSAMRWRSPSPYGPKLDLEFSAFGPHLASSREQILPLLCSSRSSSCRRRNGRGLGVRDLFIQDRESMLFHPTLSLPVHFRRRFASQNRGERKRKHIVLHAPLYVACTCRPSACGVKRVTCDIERASSQCGLAAAGFLYFQGRLVNGLIRDSVKYF